MYQIVGKNRVDFVTKEDNKNIKGYTFYRLYEAENVEGYKADKIFISDYVLDKYGYNPEVGDYVDIFYNENQKISLLQKVK